MKNNNNSILKSILVTFLLVGTNIAWSSNILKEPEPSWVNPVLMPDINILPQKQVQNGVYYRLTDTQVLVKQGQEPQYYYHYADHIVNQTGVEGSSQINLGYDPSYQRLKLHSLRVVRSNSVLNKLESARMKLIQREEDMDDLIYNGRMTLNIILDDVRVGDTIEYSYSIEGMNPVFKNIFAFSHYLNWSVPVGKLSIRLLWDKPSPLQYQLENSHFVMTQMETAGGKEYLIQGESVEPIKIDDHTPPWFSPRGTVYFSELKSWKDVALWGSQLYQDVFVADSDVKQLVSDIKSKHTDIDTQISAALRFVQDEVRYLGIELGQNSHMPRAASATLRNRYGDCKDKTVLFLTILNELGVEGFPALVNTDETLTESTIPSIHAFDHVITYIKHNNKHYWLDPTRSHQHGGIDSIHQPDYGRALVLLADARKLTEMSPAQSKYGVIVKDSFTLTSKEAIFSSESKYYGWNAERQRQRLDSQGRDKMQREYLEFYQSYYSGTDVLESFKHNDKTSENIFVMNEKYRIKDFWINNTDHKQVEADFYANLISSTLKIPDEPTRAHPLYLTHPKYLEQTIEINFEDDNWDFDNVDFVEDNKFFYFNNKVIFDKSKRQLTLIYAYRGKTDHVLSENYSDYLAALKKARKHKSYSIQRSYTSETTTEETDDDLLDILILIALLIFYVAMYLLVILLWKLARNKNSEETTAIFYPVSMPKFILMWLFTFSVYGMYWFYKNFQYIKQQEKNAIMPIARGIFYNFWYYPLWNKLVQDSENRFSRSHLPNKILAILMALAFLSIYFLSDITALIIPSFILGALLLLPLVNYILFVNGTESKALKNNSTWSFRHYLLGLLSIPMYILFLGSEVGIMPNEAVIKGNRILEYNIKFMQRRGILNPGDKLDYFYSDALLFISDDGNGFTQRHVFSYWKGDNDSLEKEQALYSEIQDVKVEWSAEFGENSIVTIVRKDGSEFLLFLSNTDRKDKVFVKALKKRWQSHLE